MSFSPKLRILPIFLIIVFLMISLKFGDIVSDFTDDTGGDVGRFTAEDLARLTSGQAVAQDADPEAPAVEDNAENEIPNLGGPETLADGENGVPPGMAPADTIDQDDYFSSGNFGDMSPGEIRLLHDLVARREAIEKKERVVKEREALLRSAEQQLLQKQAKLEDIKNSIEDLLSVYKKEQTAEAQRLVRIYSSMKPKSAAAIFNDMDMGTLIQVFRGMKERTVASIMAAMNAEKARLITRQLAEIDGADNLRDQLQ